MEKPLRDLFSFSKKEQVGIMVLVTLIVLTLILINTYDFFLPEKTYDSSTLNKKIAELVVEDSVQEGAIYQERISRKSKLNEPFDFDPNTVSKENLVFFGFSEKQAVSIINYRNKGGRMKKVEDFKKLYVVNDFMYVRLKEYIKIQPEVRKNSEEKPLKSDAVAKVVVKEEPGPIETEKSEQADLNSMNKQELIQLKGIGPIYSSRIIKYRDLLGGYTNPAQLGEVYGLKDHPEIVESLKPQLRVDMSKLKLIDINQADWKTLVSHPYIDKNVANSIIAMRKQHGTYSAVSEVERSHLVNANLYAKIAPYLTVNGNR